MTTVTPDALRARIRSLADIGIAVRWEMERAILRAHESGMSARELGMRSDLPESEIRTIVATMAADEDLPEYDDHVTWLRCYRSR